MRPISILLLTGVAAIALAAPATATAKQRYAAGDPKTWLAEAAVEVNVDFIGRDTLSQWRDVSLEVIAQPPSIERLVRFLGRRLGKGLEDEAEASRFAEGVPALLERTWAHVGEERVREYMRDARQRAGDAMRAYLS